MSDLKYRLVQVLQEKIAESIDALESERSVSPRVIKEMFTLFERLEDYQPASEPQNLAPHESKILLRYVIREALRIGMLHSPESQAIALELEAGILPGEFIQSGVE